MPVRRSVTNALQVLPGNMLWGDECPDKGYEVRLSAARKTVSRIVKQISLSFAAPLPGHALLFPSRSPPVLPPSTVLVRLFPTCGSHTRPLWQCSKFTHGYYDAVPDYKALLDSYGMPYGTTEPPFPGSTLETTQGQTHYLSSQLPF